MVWQDPEETENITISLSTRRTRAFSTSPRSLGTKKSPRVRDKQKACEHKDAGAETVAADKKKVAEAALSTSQRGIWATREAWMPCHDFACQTML